MYIYIVPIPIPGVFKSCIILAANKFQMEYWTFQHTICLSPLATPTSSSLGAVIKPTVSTDKINGDRPRVRYSIECMIT